MYDSKKIKSLFLPRSHSLNVSDKIKKLLLQLPPEAKILDLGSGSRRLARNVVNLDMKPSDEVDVVADAIALPFQSESFDCVIVQAVLEHVPEPKSVITEIERILKPDGYVYAEVPFVYPYHPSPEDYWRFTLKGIEHIFKDFQYLDSGVCVGPTCALWSILKEYFSILVDIPIIRAIMYRIVGLFAIVFSYLDLLTAKSKRAHIICSAVYFYGRKR
jgi:SAM-dependent methyltransferase